MNRLPKYENCRRWLNSGKKLTGRLAIERWYLYSYRIFIGRERKRLEPLGLDIINLNAGTGKHAEYVRSDYVKNYQKIKK
jgi:hypothetical protein